MRHYLKAISAGIIVDFISSKVLAKTFIYFSRVFLSMQGGSKVFSENHGFLAMAIPILGYTGIPLIGVFLGGYTAGKLTQKKKVFISSIVGIISVILSILYVFIKSGGPRFWYLFIPSLILVVPFAMIGGLLSKYPKKNQQQGYE